MTKFNGIKKVALGTALSGALIVGAGFGTYSWFTAEATVSGEIENGTLVLSTENGKTDLFVNAGLLRPSQSVNDSVTFINTGTEDMFLRATWDLEVIKDEENNHPDTPGLSGYTINVEATLYDENGNQLYDSVESGDLSAATVQQYLNNLGGYFPGENGETRRALKSGEQIELDFTLTLNSSAGNEYQGATIDGSLTLEGKQIDPGAEF